MSMAMQWKFAVAAALFLLAAGCMVFRGVDVPERVLVPNVELPAPESGDLHQSSLRLQPQSVKMVRRLESEAGIATDIWSSDMGRVIQGTNSGIGQAGFSIGHGTLSETRDQIRRPGISGGKGGDTEFIFSEHLNNISAEVQRVAWNGHVFYFFSKAVRTAPSEVSVMDHPSTGSEGSTVHHVVFVVDENGRRVTSFRTGEVEPVSGAVNQPPSVPIRPLYLNVLVTEKGPWALYRDRNGIFARPLVFNGPNPSTGGQSFRQRMSVDSGRPAQLAGGRGSFTFGEPILISRAKLPYRSFHFVARVDQKGDFHIVWTDRREANFARPGNRRDLWYCRFDFKAGEACHRPKRLSSNATLAPINLMVSGDEVYVSWTDNRFASGLWTRRNNAKLFLAGSGDRGTSFRKPVSIHPLKDDDERALFAITMPASGGGVLVLWSEQFRNNYFLDHDFKYGLLKPDMETFLLAENQVPGEPLHEVLINKLNDFHRSLSNR